MSDLSPTISTDTIIVKNYRWNCPDCGCKMYAQYDPRDNGGLCHKCERNQAAMDFHERFRPVVGATVESIEPPTEIYHDDDVRRLYLRDEDGERWLVTSDHDMHIYRVDEDGNVKKETQ